MTRVFLLYRVTPYALDSLLNKRSRSLAFSTKMSLIFLSAREKSMYSELLYSFLANSFTRYVLPTRRAPSKRMAVEPCMVSFHSRRWAYAFLSMPFLTDMRDNRRMHTYNFTELEHSTPHILTELEHSTPHILTELEHRSFGAVNSMDRDPVENTSTTLLTDRRHTSLSFRRGGIHEGWHISPSR